MAHLIQLINTKVSKHVEQNPVTQHDHFVRDFDNYEEGTDENDVQAQQDANTADVTLRFSISALWNLSGVCNIHK
jgi:hypothetical protein